MKIIAINEMKMIMIIMIIIVKYKKLAVLSLLAVGMSVRRVVLYCTWYCREHLDLGENISIPRFQVGW